MIPPQANAEFVCCMEDILDIYQSEYDSQNPWVCFDESCKQLVKEVEKKIPAEPGQKERYDYQYSVMVSPICLCFLSHYKVGDT